MKKERLEKMTNGWFVGNFDPAIAKICEVEIAVKQYKKDDYEIKHFHKIATEITVIVIGKVLMNGVEFTKGDIIIIDPNEATDFKALEDTITTVVKIPGASNDKYIEEPTIC